MFEQHVVLEHTICWVFEELNSPIFTVSSETKGLTRSGVGDLGLIRASGGVKALPPPLPHPTTTQTKQVIEGRWSWLFGSFWALSLLLPERV